MFLKSFSDQQTLPEIIIVRHIVSIIFGNYQLEVKKQLIIYLYIKP